MKIHDDKLNRDWYLEWSTIVDAPVTYGLSLKEYEEYYRGEYGRHGMLTFDTMIERVNKKGISAYPPFDDIECYFRHNRAGENDSLLDKEGILEKYCRTRK